MAAHRVLAELPGPVAVELTEVTVTHEPDAGGVHLDTSDCVGLDAALDAVVTPDEEDRP